MLIHKSLSLMNMVYLKTGTFTTMKQGGRMVLRNISYFSICIHFLHFNRYLVFVPETRLIELWVDHTLFPVPGKENTMEELR